MQPDVCFVIGIMQSIFVDVIQTKGLMEDEEIGPPRFFDVEHLDQRKEAQFLPTLLTRQFHVA